MAEYIEREAAIESLPVAWDSAINALRNAPSADVVQVVRCKDCKHCDPENYHCDHPMGTAAPLKRKPDDFCSYGERNDGDGNG